MNYFELFNLPVAPSVDKSLLNDRYFDLQRQNHPDFFTQAGEDQKESALTQSADINKAFNIFRDEQKTIEYFLQHKSLIGHEEKYNLPADFLMEMMEINEALTEERAEHVLQTVTLYEAQLKASIQTIIENYDDNNIDMAALLKLKDYYYKKKYLNRILDRLGD